LEAVRVVVIGARTGVGAGGHGGVASGDGTAVAHGAPWMGSDHVLQALLADPQNSAGVLVEREKMDPRLLVDVARMTWPTEGGAAPVQRLAVEMNQAGVLLDPNWADRRRPVMDRLAARVAGRANGTSPALALLESEAAAETIRLGHDRTTLTHLVMAVISFEAEMAASGLRPVPEYSPACDYVLHPRVDRDQAILAAALTRPEGEAAPPGRRRRVRNDYRHPPWTVAAARAADEARRLAWSAGKAPAGSAHLLSAVLSDPDDAGRRLLRDLSVDPAEIQRRLTERLGPPA
jgi:hypothetical protein